MMKKEYEAPQIMELGSLTDITKLSWIGEYLGVLDYQDSDKPEIFASFVS